MASIISAGTTSGTSLNLSGDTSGVLQLASNGSTTAVTINASQQVGIGTSSPAQPLDVVTNSSANGISIRGRSSDNIGALRLYSNDGSTQYGVLRSASDEIRFNAVTSIPLTFGTANTERMRVNAGAPILCLAGGNTSATGTGIAFPASQSASSDANTLDDYEEGTWTPTGNGITYSTAVGSYIKVGRMVMATFNVTFPSTADGSGAQIKSLPFTVTTGNSYQSGAYVSATDSSTAKNSNFTIGGTTLIFRDNTNSDVANSSFSTKFVQGTAMYFADA
jgi:hypothetical protein